MDKTLENLIGALSVIATDRIGDAIAAAYPRGGETPAALASIGAAPGISVSGLQSVLRLSQPGTVRLVDRLIADGLAEKRTGDDARQSLIHLTQKGRRMRRKILDARHDAVAALLAPLSPADRGTLEELLNRVLVPYPSCEMDKYQACRLCDQSVCDPCPLPGEGVKR
ncbi:MAG: MarR family transcriptional regulator [Pseudomonadota bacterium]